MLPSLYLVRISRKSDETPILARDARRICRQWGVSYECSEGPGFGLFTMGLPVEWADELEQSGELERTVQLDDIEWLVEAEMP